MIEDDDYADWDDAYELEWADRQRIKSYRKARSLRRAAQQAAREARESHDL